MNFDQLLIDSDPARDVSFSPDSSEVQQILLSILNSEQAIPPRRRRIRSRVVVSVAAAATVAVIAGGVLPLFSGGTQSAAAATLRKFADVAAAQPALQPLGPGQYYFTQSENLQQAYAVDKGFQYTQLAHRDMWLRSDGSFHLTITYEPGVLIPSTRNQWVAAGSPALTQVPIDQAGGPGGIPDGVRIPINNVSTQPAQLLSQVESAGATQDPSQVFILLASLLEETTASPALRAAVLTDIATLGGVKSLGTVRDQLGITGEGFSIFGDGMNQVAIFEPTTGNLVAQETYQDGALVSWWDFVAGGIADSASETVAPHS
jgi:hypothetical protein